MSSYWKTLRHRKFSRRTMLGASAKAGVGAAGLALVGCGDDDDDAAAIDTSAVDAAASDAAAAASAASDAAAAAGRAAEAAESASALAAEAAASEDAEQAAAAAQAAADAAADAAAAAEAAGEAGAAAVAQAAADAAEAAAQAAREAGAEDAAAGAAAAQAAADAAAAAAAAAQDASAAAAEAAGLAAEAVEAAESAAMAAEDDMADEASGAFADIDLDASITTAVPTDAGGTDQHRSGSHLNYISHASVYASGVETHPDTNAVIPHMVAPEFVDDVTMVADVRPAPFHDGSILSAEDLVFTYERAGNLAEYHQGGETSDHAAGWTSSRAQYGSQNWVRSEARDDRTWVVELHEPNATFLGVIVGESPTSLAIVSKAYTERVGDAVMDREPMGTGPYRFVSHGEDTDFVFTRHDDHLNPLDHPINVSHVPFHKDLTVLVRPEVLSQVAGLEAGELDLLYELSTKDVEGLVDDPDFVIHYEGDRAHLLYWNLNNPVMEDGSPNPFLDIRVREAANISLNRQAIIDNLGALPGNPLFTGPTAFGYPSPEQIEAAGLNFPYDPERGRELMAEAGYADGFDTTLHTVLGVWGGLPATLALVVQQDLAAIGIRLTIKEYTAAQYFSDAGARQRPNAPGIWMFGSAFHPDIQSVVNCCIVPEGTYTISLPSDDIVALARAQAKELDSQKRGEMVSQLFLDHAKGHYHGFLVSVRKAQVTRSDIRWPAGAVQSRNWNHLYAAQKLRA